MENIRSAKEAGYHLSKYNLFKNIPNENLIICVNLLKASYSKIDPNDLTNLYNLEQIKENDEILKYFIHQGIIVNYDELEFLKAMVLRNSNNINNNVVKITIAVTLACNFNCPYCFENHKSGKMNNEIQDKVFKLIKEMVKASNNKKLQITWYGGEPLLAIDVIESLSKRIIEFVEKEKIFYTSSIITNGFLLNQKNIEILNKARITHYQITLDGIAENHNITRHLINGQPSFDQIINNLLNNKINGHIVIRHNVHKGNKQDIKKLKKLIEEIRQKSGNDLEYYSAIVINNPAEKHEDQVDFLDLKDKIELQLNRDIKNFLSYKCYFCGAQTFWMICIDNEGNLFKCWEDVGKIDRSFGNINNWSPFNPLYTCSNLDMLTKYLNSAACIADEECQKCIWLPLCAGECPSKKFFWNIKCINYKNNPEIFISKFIENIENKNNK